MTTKELIELVNDFALWKGDAFRLASLVMHRQQEDDAALAESVPEIADAIRNQ